MRRGWALLGAGAAICASCGDPTTPAPPGLASDTNRVYAVKDTALPHISYAPICADDFDDDGDDDVLLKGGRLWTGGTSYLATGSVSTWLSSPSHAVLLCPGDLDGDGYPDVFAPEENASRQALSPQRLYSVT